MSKKIAVTGAQGRLGRFVLDDLQARAYEVRALTKEWWEECPVDDQAAGDILDYDWLREVLAGCDGVIHLAAIPSPKRGSDSAVIEINVVGTYNVLLAAGENGINRVASASSDCTFGFTFSRYPPQPVYLPVDEEHPTHPDDSYGLSKVLGERAADAVTQRFPGMYAASMRISHVVGPDDYEPDSEFCKWRSNPERGPANLWSYVDGRDASQAFRLAIEADRSGHEIFCIASKKTRSSIPTQELIGMFYPQVALKREFPGYESLENSEKATRILGYAPKY